MAPVTVYVFMPEEGVDVWRPVDAEPVSPGVYRITSPDPDPNNEVWQFRSGDLVRCELRPLEGGEQLVAVAKADGPRVMTVVEGEQVSPELSRLLLAVFHALARSEFVASAVALEPCFRFLSSPAGRTNANCVAADLFFCLPDGWGEVSWQGAPAGLREVYDNIEHGLHDTISAPEIARNFDATPEQLLDALRKTGLVK